MTKRCTFCKREKEIEDFSRGKSNKDGFRGHCKKCRAKEERIYKLLHKEQTQKQRIKEKLIKYGLTIEEYIQLFKNQNGKCAICEKEMNLSIDHNHKNGKIRGLLCRNCNFGIGFMEDSTRLLEKAIKYLKKKQ